MAAFNNYRLWSQLLACLPQCPGLSRKSSTNMRKALKPPSCVWRPWANVYTFKCVCLEEVINRRDPTEYVEEKEPDES